MFHGKDAEEITELVMQKSENITMRKKSNLAKNKCVNLKKSLFLRAVDSKWMDHIDTMDQFRQGIHLRAYGQIDPLREYQQEGFAMFETMVEAIEEEVAKYIMKAEIRNNLQREEVAKGQAVNPKEDGESEEKASCEKGPNWS